VLAGAGGWYGSGWRHAVDSEVCDLFGKLGAVISPCPLNPILYDDILLGNQVANHFAYLGITHVFNTNPDLGIATASIGYYNDVMGTNTLLVGVAIAEYASNPNTSIARVEFDETARDVAINPFGHFLVRPIPEPGTHLLIFAGLLSLAGWRRARA